jgi:hypothetical protein
LVPFGQVVSEEKIKPEALKTSSLIITGIKQIMKDMI